MWVLVTATILIGHQHFRKIAISYNLFQFGVCITPQEYKICISCIPFSFCVWLCTFFYLSFFVLSPAHICFFVYAHNYPGLALWDTFSNIKLVFFPASRTAFLCRTSPDSKARKMREKKIWNLSKERRKEITILMVMMMMKNWAEQPFYCNFC